MSIITLIKEAVPTMENGGGITLLQTRDNNNTISRCGGGYIFVVPGYTTIKFKRWGVWQI